jgi:hypothetical protein
MLLRFAKIYLFLHPSGHFRLACVARLKSELFGSLYQRYSNRFAGVHFFRTKNSLKNLAKMR